MYGTGRNSSTLLNLSTRAVEGGEWCASHSGRFTPRESSPGTHWIGGWVGCRAGLDAMNKEEISCPCWELNPDS
jgi:hypothetical protein